MVSQHKDFDASFKLLQTQLSALRVKLSAEKELLPDLVGKEARLQRLEVSGIKNHPKEYLSKMRNQQAQPAMDVTHVTQNKSPQAVIFGA